MKGQLAGIARRESVMGPMIELEAAPVTRECGVAFDPRGLPGPRQVSILLERDWREVGFELRAQLPWTARRANLLISGLELPIYSREPYWLEIGDDLVLAVNGEMAPCWRMELEHEGLSSALALDWRCGRLSSVVRSGYIQLGDRVQILNSPPEVTIPPGDD